MNRRQLIWICFVELVVIFATALILSDWMLMEVMLAIKPFVVVITIYFSSFAAVAYFMLRER